MCELFNEYDVYCDVIFDGVLVKTKIRDVIGKKISDFIGHPVSDIIYKSEVFNE